MVKVRSTGRLLSFMLTFLQLAGEDFALDLQLDNIDFGVYVSDHLFLLRPFN